MYAQDYHSDELILVFWTWGVITVMILVFGLVVSMYWLPRFLKIGFVKTTALALVYFYLQPHAPTHTARFLGSIHFASVF